jgi:NAD/NADP transhydrogenase beta subunit
MSRRAADRRWPRVLLSKHDTMMLFGDAKKMTEEIVRSME